MFLSRGPTPMFWRKAIAVRWGPSGWPRIGLQEPPHRLLVAGGSISRAQSRGWRAQTLEHHLPAYSSRLDIRQQAVSIQKLLSHFRSIAGLEKTSRRDCRVRSMCAKRPGHLEHETRCDSVLRRWWLRIDCFFGLEFLLTSSHWSWRPLHSFPSFFILTINLWFVYIFSSEEHMWHCRTSEVKEQIRKKCKRKKESLVTIEPFFFIQDKMFDRKSSVLLLFFWFSCFANATKTFCLVSRKRS